MLKHVIETLLYRNILKDNKNDVRETLLYNWYLYDCILIIL